MSQKPQDKTKPVGHFIQCDFPDDHTIDGLKIRIEGVTPEQMYIAAMHLTRTANAAADFRMQQAMQAQQPAIDGLGGRGDPTQADIAKIMRDPRGGIRQ